MAAALLAGSIAASSTWVGCGTDADGGPPSSPIADAAADMDVAEFGPHQVTYLTTIPDAFVGAYTIGIPANADPLTFQSSARLDIRSDAAFLTGGFGNMGFEKFRIESGDFWLTTDRGGNDFIRIPLASNGGFTKVVDVDTGNGGGFGRIDVDRDAPLVSVSSRGAGEGLTGAFPWSPVVVALSEAVDPGEIPGSITTDVPTLTVDPIVPDPAYDFGRVASATLHASSWATLGGKSAQVSVGRLYDPSGNGSALGSGSVTFVSVPTAPSFDFASGASSVLGWDTNATGTLLFHGPSDSVCETGSCIELGPYDDRVTCGFRGDVGFAASVVTSAPVTKVHVRYRFLVTTPDGSPIGDQTRLANVTAYTTRTSASSDLGFVTKDLLPSSDLGMTETTTWRDIVLTLSVPATEIGVVLQAGLYCHPGGEDPIDYDDDRSILLVGGITAD